MVTRVCSGAVLMPRGVQQSMEDEGALVNGAAVLGGVMSGNDDTGASIAVGWLSPAVNVSVEFDSADMSNSES